MEKEFKEFRERLVVSKQLFYNDSSMFGAYGFSFEGEINPEISVHPQYKNFSIAGNVQPLVEGEAYTVIFKESYDERRKIDTYTFIEVESDGISGKKANEEFLRVILTDNQAEAIIDKFGYSDELVKDILNNKVDITEVKGIKSATALSIKEKLTEMSKYSKAVIELAPLGASIKAVVSLADHYGSVEKLLYVIENNIYDLTSAGGFGFKRIDEYGLKKGISIDSPQRIRAGALYVIEQMVALGDTKLSIDKFEENLCDILEIDEVDDETFGLIINDPNVYYDNGYISLKKYRREEELIVEHLRRIRDSFTSYDTNELEDIIKMNEDRLGFTFNEQQKEAIRKAVSSGVFILDGLAGSGKTSSLKTAIDIIGLPHVACALSGKAANVLSQNGLKAKTIHRTLRFDPVNFGFLHNEENPLSEKVVILDEASMVDNKLFLDLIKAVASGSQLMIVGDSGQLPSISRGAVFDNLLDTTEFEHVTLTEVHRQAKESGTLQVANKIREGTQFNGYTDYGLTVYGDNKDFYYFGFQDRAAIKDNLLHTVKRYLSNKDMNPSDIQVITGLKEKGELSVVNLNKELQELFNPQKIVQNTLTGKIYEFRKGDRVIQQGNKYAARTLGYSDFQDVANGFALLENKTFEETEVFNGTFGEIIECASGVGMLIKFEGVEELVFYEHTQKTNEIGIIDLGYAISCHRSQGSGFKTLVGALSFSDYMLLSRQFLYTMLTRTINQCFLFAETSAVHYSIKTDKGKTRKCFISEFLEH
ncbi:AAA family ATPase [Staphylococcus hominis]|uniref:AAA family ATPase n=1 Tax=Staphylococcus hominis TaxID=1290 RepID=UPI002878292E|nr:AAA family ATPase [Staphylococcus hominis]MDS3884627.1 AAA family ATPase [Staphylococcus hominis]MDS3884773.1 AAA family ATPase [Staphylococcus hominis]